MPEQATEVVAFELPFTLFGSRIYVGDEGCVKLCEQWFRDKWRECSIITAEDVAAGRPHVGSELKRRIVIEAPVYG